MVQSCIICLLFCDSFILFPCEKDEAVITLALIQLTMTGCKNAAVLFK